jgi:hypothetical protein
VGQGRPDRVQRALQVGVDHLLEVLARKLEERAVRADAGVRDHDVEAAEPLDRRGDRSVHRVRVADVAGNPEPALEVEAVPSARRQTDRGADLVQ